MKTGKNYLKVTERRFKYYKISQIANILNVSQRTIRYYEQIGLLPSTRRTKGQMRLYTQEELLLIKKIKKMQQEFHMSLESIKNKIKEDLEEFSKKREKSKYKIVVDSTASLPSDIIERYNIEVIPMKIMVGKSVFDDGENIDPKDIDKILESSRKNIKTSPPDCDEIMDFYSNIYERGAEKIISIHLSSELSDIFFHAQKAAKNMKQLIDIEVIDSRCMALGSGLLALEAAQMFQEKNSFSNVIAKIKKMTHSIKELLFVDSIPYLTKGDNVHQYLNLLIDFKPIFTTSNGSIQLLSKITNKSKNEYQKIFLRQALKAKKMIGLFHNNFNKEIKVLKKKITSTFPDITCFLSNEMSAIPLVYFGPKALGMVIY